MATKKKAAAKKKISKKKLTQAKKAVWDRPPPRSAKHKHLTPARKAKAKAAARRAGRHYPNLVDNMRAAK